MCDHGTSSEGAGCKCRQVHAFNTCLPVTIDACCQPLASLMRICLHSTTGLSMALTPTPTMAPSMAPWTVTGGYAVLCCIPKQCVMGRPPHHKDSKADSECTAVDLHHLSDAWPVGIEVLTLINSALLPLSAQVQWHPPSLPTPRPWRQCHQACKWDPPTWQGTAAGRPWWSPPGRAKEWVREALTQSQIEL
jgi:hypothetical protein